jgi:hypothetical protein
VGWFLSLQSWLVEEPFWVENAAVIEGLGVVQYSIISFPQSLAGALERDEVTRLILLVVCFPNSAGH